MGPGTPVVPAWVPAGCAGLWGGPLGLPAGRTGDLVLTEQLPHRRRFSLARVRVQPFRTPLAPPSGSGSGEQQPGTAARPGERSGHRLLAGGHGAELVPFPFVTPWWVDAGGRCCLCSHLAFAAEFL